MTTSKQADTEPGAMEQWIKGWLNGEPPAQAYEFIGGTAVNALERKAREIDATIADLTARLNAAEDAVIHARQLLGIADGTLPGDQCSREHALADALREAHQWPLAEGNTHTNCRQCVALAGQPTTCQHKADAMIARGLLVRFRASEGSNDRAAFRLLVKDIDAYLGAAALGSQPTTQEGDG